MLSILMKEDLDLKSLLFIHKKNVDTHLISKSILENYWMKYLLKNGCLRIFVVYFG